MKATDQYFPVILFIMLYKVRVSKAIVKRARKTEKKSWRTMLIVRSQGRI